MKNKAKILVVEDSPICQRVVHKALADKGYDVQIAASGNDAIMLVKQENFSGIFMDVGLPDVSGIEATRKIREIELAKNKHTPIIGFTTHENLLKECIEAGMDQLLNKPFEDAELNKILEWLRGKK